MLRNQLKIEIDKLGFAIKNNRISKKDTIAFLKKVEIKTELNKLGLVVKGNAISKKDAIAVIKKYKIKGTGEMFKEDLEKGGDFYEDRLYLEDICKQAGVKCTVKPFDVYQGPFAQLTNGGRLWYGDKMGDLHYEGPGGDKALNEEAMIEYLKKFAGPKLAFTNPKEPKSTSDKKAKLNLIKSVLYEIIAVDPSSKPPKRWWNKMKKKIKKNNPSYNDEKVRQTIGDIWYHKLSKAKRSEIRKREGKSLK